MKVVQLSALVLPLLAAIAPLPAQAQTKTLHFQCNAGRSFVAQIKPKSALIKLDTGESLTLLPLDSRIGQKFANLNTLFAIHDNEAYVEERFVKVLTQCVTLDPTTNLSSQK